MERARLTSHELALTIIKSMHEHPSQWTVDKHTAKHKDGIVVWIANGRLSLRVKEPFEMRFSCRDVIRLWRAVEDLKTVTGIEMLR